MPPRRNTNYQQPSTSSIDDQFESFFYRWLNRQEQFLVELSQSISNGKDYEDEDEEEEEERLKELINHVLSHYSEYYEAKSRVARQNVFLLFSPTWFSSLEITLLWITGFKPGLAFGLITNSVSDLSEAQAQAIERLKFETRTKERELADELAKVQESVAALPIFELARRAALPIDGELADLGPAIESFGSAMEVLVLSADFLRGATMLKIRDILSSAQTVKILISAAEFQLQIRRWGFERDGMRA